MIGNAPLSGNITRQSWHIMIVDDSADDCANIRQLLLHHAERNYTFAEAETGATGLALLRNIDLRRPTCVILDYNLPDMDAPVFLAALASMGELVGYPTIVLTGMADRATGREVLRAGAEDFLGKSWLMSDSLTRAVENAVERHELARELRQQSAILLRREQELQDNSRKKDEFLATLAHELRNPIAPISNGLAILREQNDAATEPVRLMMERQLEHLVRLVDDLLDISRISSGKIELRVEPVAVSAVLEHALETTRSLVASAGHTLEVSMHDATLSVDGDPIRLAQVVGNLLNNSIKYTPKGGRILVEVFGEGAFVVIRVTDNGAGIAAAMLPHIFDLFVQIDGTVDHAQGGLGVGLTLVKRFLEMHNGTVTAESAGLGYGSTFTIRLPRSQQLAPPLVPARRPTNDSSVTRRIIIVDDSIDGADSLAMMLQLHGHDTRTANSGEEALVTADDFRPEIAFLDIGLPGINGYELARLLRKASAGQPVLLVAVTGWGSDDDKRKASDAGFDVHLTKPVDAQRVLALINNLADFTGKSMTSLHV